jgi:hypothetical protein
VIDEAQHWLQQFRSSHTRAHDDANGKVTENYFVLNLTLQAATENIVDKIKKATNINGNPKHSYIPKVNSTKLKNG